MCPACIGSSLLLLTGASSAGGLALIVARVRGARPPAWRFAIALRQMRAYLDRVLAIRALFFVAVLPGVVAGYVPYRMLLAAGRLAVPAISVATAAAIVLIVIGAMILLRCVWDFFASGKGTLAPMDPPRNLVVNGLYRYTRNPMYNGVLAVLMGEAWLFHGISVLIYAACVFVAFHLFVVLYEEPALEARFQESYRSYRRSVPRWGFTTRPYNQNNE